MKIRKIICPTDLTPDSGAALRYGLALARAYEAQLIQLYCEPKSPTLVADGNPPAPTELMREELVKNAGTDQIDNLSIQSVVVGCDDPGDCITREAARYGADLIIMPSRRRPHRAALLGSVRESSCRTPLRP